MRMKLTDLNVKNLAPGSYYDATLPSFGLRVGKEARTFIVIKDGIRKKLGRYPFLTLQNARQRALEVIYGPSVKHDTRTVSQAITDYLERIDVRPSTFVEYKRYLTSYLRPKLGPKILSQIQTIQIISIIDSIELPSEANHAQVAIKVFFNWCVKRSYIQSSPCGSLCPPNKTQARSRTLTDDELRKVWTAEGLSPPYITMGIGWLSCVWGALLLL